MILSKYIILVAISLVAIDPGTNKNLKGKARSDPQDSEEDKCYYNNFKLYGKIQIVDSFPDIKVKVVTSFPDLKVMIVENFPDKCGKWKMVTEFPDLKVQFVNAFPDIKIQYVEAFPGIEKQE